MKISKKLLAGLIVFSLIGAAFATVPLWAADTAPVSATVTPKLISVSVTDGTVAYGTVVVNSTKSTLPVELNDTQTATNDGNVTEKLQIKSSDAISSTSGTNWTLAGTNGADQYIHKFSKDSGSTWAAMTTAYQDLALGVISSGTQAFDLQITTPTSTTGYERRDITVTVLATE